MAVAQAVPPPDVVNNDDNIFDDGFPQPKEHACTIIWVKSLGFMTTVWIMLFHTERVSTFISAYINGDDKNYHPYEDNPPMAQFVLEVVLESAVFCYIPAIAFLSFVTIQICSISIRFYRGLGRARCIRLIRFHRLMAIPLLYIVFEVGANSISQLLAIQGNDYYLLSLLKQPDPGSLVLGNAGLIEMYLKSVIYFFLIVIAALNYCVFKKVWSSLHALMSGGDLSGIERGSLGSRGSLPSCSTATRVHGGALGSGTAEKR
ncbi:hypothetical protein PMAYCL1PPCAC_24279 [Pristionchus mayeri]|uniref:Uncharacterized protein n=1 Tax=Pristionchus mayeri TaxID=1317129 RepID=A0AAN5D1V5_9BILA|nr:hypothetical protein PMAYCL1PPCAC_24279 [Pristionchus mayeri]